MTLQYVPKRFRSETMCPMAVSIYPETIRHVPEALKESVQRAVAAGEPKHLPRQYQNRQPPVEDLEKQPYKPAMMPLDDREALLARLVEALQAPPPPVPAPPQMPSFTQRPTIKF